MQIRSAVRGKRSAIDLTTGTPIKRILVFMAPLLVGNLFQQLYSMVDTVIVGQTLGADALSGVGSTGAISFLIMGFVSGLAQGFSVTTSQRRGANDEEGMRKSFANGITFTVIIISALTALSVLVTEPLLRAMNTYYKYLPYALDYITTIFGGMILSAFYNEFSSTLRAIGDSFMPLMFLIVASLLNVGLDCLCILGFDMGVRGAAVATLISQGVSAVATFLYMWIRYPVLRFRLRHFKTGLRMTGEQLKIGIPMALQFSVISIGMIFGQSALNGMDPKAITAYVAASKIDNFAGAAISSIGSAATTFVGQNFGAKKYERIKTGINQLLIYSLIMAVVLGALVISLYRPLTGLFISAEDRSEQLYSFALEYLIYNAGFYVLLATLYAWRSSLQGMGRGAVTLLAAAAEVAMRVGVSIWAMNADSYTAVCMCNSAAWLGANIMLLPSFLIALNKYIPLFRKKLPRLPNPSFPPEKR